MSEPRDAGRSRQAAPASASAAWRAVHVFVLASFALTQPVLDLLARDAGFLVAHDVGAARLAVLIVVWAFVVPAGIAGLGLLAARSGVRVGGAVHAGLVAALLGAIALPPLGRTGLDGVVLLGASLVLGVVGAVAYSRSSALRATVSVLVIAPPLFVAAFVLDGDVRRATGGADAATLRALAAAVEVGRPVPVMLVVFDELPLLSLLDADWGLAEQLFPNFARLADTSTWYRNATTVHEATEIAVPALLTGRRPTDPDALATARDHPRNVFTMLARSHDVYAEEPVTRLSSGSARTDVSLAGLLLDTAAAAAHVLAPPEWRVSLPPVTETWGGFLAGVDVDVAGEGEGEGGGGGGGGAGGGVDEGEVGVGSAGRGGGADVGVDDREHGGAGADDASGGRGASRQASPRRPEPAVRVDRLARFRTFVDALGGTNESPDERGVAAESGPGAAVARPRLDVLHVMLPHSPWLYLPSTRRYDGGDRVHGRDGPRWADDAGAVRLAQQRHVLQVGAVDTLLGELLDRLEALGRLDETLMIVTSDHGLAFEPGRPYRAIEPSAPWQIVRVPLFVKRPGQRTGDVDDRNVELIDLLPTIADVLDVRVDWAWDGTSVFGERPREMKRIAGRSDGGWRLDGARSDDWPALQAWVDAVGHEPRWEHVYGSGARRGWMGTPLERLDVPIGVSPVRAWIEAVDRFEDVDLTRGSLPCFVVGRLEAPGARVLPTEIVVAVDGVLRASASVFDVDGARASFAALLPEAALNAGANDVAVLAVAEAPDGAVSLFELTSDVARLEGDVVVHGDGRRVPIVPGRALGHLNTIVDDPVRGAAFLIGWAVDPSGPAPVDRVLVFAGTSCVRVGVPDEAREFDGSDGVRRVRAGFRWSIPGELVRGRVRVFAEVDGVVSEFRYAAAAQERR